MLGVYNACRFTNPLVQGMPAAFNHCQELPMKYPIRIIAILVGVVSLCTGAAAQANLRDAIEARPQGADKLALILSDASAELARMDRYERRALWRRKFAIREFDAAQAAAAEERKA